MMDGFHAALTSTYWNEICIILTQRVQLMKWRCMKQNQIQSVEIIEINEFAEIAP